MRSRKFLSGFTLIEVLVVVVIISMLAALLFPVFTRAQEKAAQTSCMNNLRQICMAVHMYTQDNNEQLPTNPGTSWASVFGKYLHTATFNCPSLPGIPGTTDNPDYGFNRQLFGKSMGKIITPSSLVIATDLSRTAMSGDFCVDFTNMETGIDPRHNQGQAFCVAMADGSVKVLQLISGSPTATLSNAQVGFYPVTFADNPINVIAPTNGTTFHSYTGNAGWNGGANSADLFFTMDPTRSGFNYIGVLLGANGTLSQGITFKKSGSLYAYVPVEADLLLLNTSGGPTKGFLHSTWVLQGKLHDSDTTWVPIMPLTGLPASTTAPAQTWMKYSIAPSAPFQDIQLYGKSDPVNWTSGESGGFAYLHLTVIDPTPTTP